MMFEEALAAGQDPRRVFAGVIPGIEAVESTVPRPGAPSPPVARTESDELPLEKTIGMVYDGWIQTKADRRATRKSGERDYRRHMTKVLDSSVDGVVVRGMPASAMTPQVLVAIRQNLLESGGQRGEPLGRSYVQNIVSGSLRAFVRDALLPYLSADPYASPEWARWPRARLEDERTPPNPFFPPERDKILTLFESYEFLVNNRKRAIPAYLGWVAVQFLAGLSPSEASGLWLEDIALDSGFLLVRRSYNSGEYEPTKNARRRRTVALDDRLGSILATVLPSEASSDAPAFPNTRGNPIEPKTFDPIFRRAQNELGIAPRGAYCMKDTFVSLSLMANLNEDWIERQTGVRIETLRAHYAKWYPQASRAEFAKLRDFEAGVSHHPGGSAGGSGFDREEDECDTETERY